MRYAEPATPMRHYPAYCSDCKRLWLVATPGAPSASPTCPRCGDLGRLVPGAYYSDPASLVFAALESAIATVPLSAPALAALASELEDLLPSPSEAEIEAAFADVVERFAVGPALGATPGKRVALRMVVTIATALSQPVVRASGIVRLPQTIQGLFTAPKAPQ